MKINRRNFLWGMSSLSLSPFSHGQTQKSIAAPVDKIKRLDKLCFGSCNKHNHWQPLWSKIASENPDLFMWLGDVVYCDTESPFELKTTYTAQKYRFAYKLFNLQIPVIGTWDDHDYGQNNSDSKNPIKDVAKDAFLDFVNEPSSSPRRLRDGIYTSYEFGGRGQKAKVILLDLRYNKTETELLGNEQWNWLEDELARSDAQVHLIATSIPFVAPLLMKVEHWKRYPQEYHRMHKVIDTYRPNGLLFLTGDQHMAGQFQGNSLSGTPIYEVMSSGMTHYANRVISPYLNKMYGKTNYFIDKNYGSIELKWDDTISLKVEVKSNSGKYGLSRLFQLVDGQTTLIEG